MRRSAARGNSRPRAAQLTMHDGRPDAARPNASVQGAAPDGARCPGAGRRTARIWSAKPISNRRSASSNTQYCTVRRLRPSTSVSRCTSRPAQQGQAQPAHAPQPRARAP